MKILVLNLVGNYWGGSAEVQGLSTGAFVCDLGFFFPFLMIIRKLHLASPHWRLFFVFLLNFKYYFLN